jgi:hypothetical protein
MKTFYKKSISELTGAKVIKLFDPVEKAFLNSLRCPICGSQIDMFKPTQTGGTHFNYGCATDYDHYVNEIDFRSTNGFIRYEIIRIYEGSHLYEIDQYVGKTVLRLADIDPERRIIPNEEGKSYQIACQFDKKLFDFQNTNREKILNRVKTLLVFT